MLDRFRAWRRERRRKRAIRAMMHELKRLDQPWEETIRTCRAIADAYERREGKPL